jgi:hypothetical protein
VSFVGHYSSWPVEVGQLESGVVYQVHADGRVYRLEPAHEQGGPGRVQLVGQIDRVPTELGELWDECERVYWEEITLVPVTYDDDLTPVRSVSTDSLRVMARGE